MKKQDESIYTAIGEHLKYQRTRLRFTVEQIAEQVDVTPRYIQDLERGTVGMSLTTLVRFCKVLEISADALLFGEPTGIDALLRDEDKEKVEQIEELVRLQLKIMQK